MLDTDDPALWYALNRLLANYWADVDDRRQHGTITTRHLVNNLRAFRDAERRTRAIGVMSLYRADGPPPIERVRDKYRKIELQTSHLASVATASWFDNRRARSGGSNSTQMSAPISFRTRP